METKHPAKNKTDCGSYGWWTVILLSGWLSCCCCNEAKGQGNVVMVDPVVTVLYYSAQSKTSNIFSGSYSKTTDKYERGTVTVTAAGPISYTIKPALLQINVKESKTWKGEVRVDSNKAPPPGKSAVASLSADYEIFYSCPTDMMCTGGAGVNAQAFAGPTWTCDPSPQHPCAAGHTAPGPHHLVKEKATIKRNFTVYSIDAKIDGPDTVCDGYKAKYTVTTYPEGGAISWSDGSSGSSTEVTVTSSQTLTVTYTIGGVSCQAQKKIFKRQLGPEISVGATFEGSETVLAEGEKIKVLSKEVMKNIPAKISVQGPDITINAKARDCCDDSARLSPLGDKKIEVTATMGISAENIPFPFPPGIAGSISKEFSKFGLTIAIEGYYGLLVNAGAVLTGKGEASLSKCKKPPFCFGVSIGLDIPIKIHVSGGGKVCLRRPPGSGVVCSGTTKAGNPCKAITRNLCGYCQHHTEQSWWCDYTCAELKLELASISTNFYGSIGYASCSSPSLSAEIGMGKVMLSFLQVDIAGYEFGPDPIEVWGGAVFYQYP